MELNEANEIFDEESFKNSHHEADKPVLVINIKPVTTTLIIICFVVYLIELFDYSLINYFAFSKNNLFSDPFVLISNAFIHANITHLLFNIGFLFFLGNALEIHTNSKLVLTLFILSVLISNLSFLIFFPENSSIGISGFIYGLIGSLMIIKPKLKILIPIGIISIPAPVYIAGPVLAFAEFILSSVVTDGIAHIAHFSGFIVGLIIGLIYHYKVRSYTKGLLSH